MLSSSPSSSSGGAPDAAAFAAQDSESWQQLIQMLGGDDEGDAPDVHPPPIPRVVISVSSDSDEDDERAGVAPAVDPSSDAASEERPASDAAYEGDDEPADDVDTKRGAWKLCAGAAPAGQRIPIPEWYGESSDVAASMQHYIATLDEREDKDAEALGQHFDEEEEVEYEIYWRLRDEQKELFEDWSWVRGYEDVASYDVLNDVPHSLRRYHEIAQVPRVVRPRPRRRRTRGNPDQGAAPYPPVPAYYPDDPRFVHWRFWGDLTSSQVAARFVMPQMPTLRGDCPAPEG